MPINPYQNNYNSQYQNMYNQYQNSLYSQNVLPPQQVIRVNGKASIDTLQMAPNSSVLVMDTSAPLVWLCVTDGLGKVSATAYDIIAHQEKPPVDVNSMEQRLFAVESALKEMEGRLNAKSNVKGTRAKQTEPEYDAD